jgi:cytochrome c oxidase subunit 2
MRKILFLPPQSSTMARELDQLHYSVILVTMLGATAVALAAAYFILRYRKSAHRGTLTPDPDPTRTPGGIPYWLEFAFIGFLLVLFVTWWVIGFRQFVRLEVAPAGALEIYVTGKQWMWTFAYPNGSGSNAVLYVPAGRPVKLVMSSRDVIHSFFVPSFRVKKDVIPGRITTMWFEVPQPGVYPVFCTEYCGEGHSTMRAQVVALSELDYSARLEAMPRLELAGPAALVTTAAGQAPGESISLASMGERVAVTHGCMRCHTADGAPHIGPTWAGVYGSIVTLTTGERIVVDEAYLTESMMDPQARLRRGFQPVMPGYQGLLSAGETGALVEYIRSLRDTPADARLSPLAPAGAPPVELPQEAPGQVRSGLREEVVPEPLGPVQPRPDLPPYAPPGTDPGTAPQPGNRQEVPR